MDTICIDERCFHSKKPVAYSYALIRNENDITIFALNNPSHRYFCEQIPNVLNKILKYWNLEQVLQKYKWTFVIGAGATQVIIDTKNNIPTTLTLSNSAVLQPYCSSFTISEYKDAVENSSDFVAKLLEKYPPLLRSTFQMDPITFYLVTTPLHPKYIYQMMKHPYGKLDLDKHPVLFVDREKFIERWRAQCRPNNPTLFRFFNGEKQYNIDFDDNELLSSTVQETLKYEIPDTMAEGVGFDHNGKIRFINGRHRTVNLANLGAPLIPLQVQKECLEKFRKMFE